MPEIKWGKNLYIIYPWYDYETDQTYYEMKLKQQYLLDLHLNDTRGFELADSQIADFVDGNQSNFKIDNLFYRNKTKDDPLLRTPVRDVVSEPDRFWISRCGILISKITNKVLSQTLSKTGYWTHATKIGGRKGTNRCYKIHRLVADAYVPNVYKKPFINHLDGQKKHNKAYNLEWVTPKENSQHARDTGLLEESIIDRSGVKAKQSKFDIEKIKLAISMQQNGFSHAKIAKLVGTARSSVSYLLQGKTYTNELKMLGYI